MIMASKEYQYRSNGRDYYKTVVLRGGSVVPGSRSLGVYTGRTLKRKLADLQDDIDNGAWREPDPEEVPRCYSSPRHTRPLN